MRRHLPAILPPVPATTHLIGALPSLPPTRTPFVTDNTQLTKRGVIELAYRTGIEHGPGQSLRCARLLVDGELLSTLFERQILNVESTRTFARFDAQPRRSEDGGRGQPELQVSEWRHDTLRTSSQSHFRHPGLVVRNQLGPVPGSTVFETSPDFLRLCLAHRVSYGFGSAARVA